MQAYLSVFIQKVVHGAVSFDTMPARYSIPKCHNIQYSVHYGAIQKCPQSPFEQKRVAIFRLLCACRCTRRNQKHVFYTRNLWQYNIPHTTRVEQTERESQRNVNHRALKYLQMPQQCLIEFLLLASEASTCLMHHTCSIPLHNTLDITNILQAHSVKSLSRTAAIQTLSADRRVHAEEKRFDPIIGQANLYGSKSLVR